jgi:hypothetical protein
MQSVVPFASILAPKTATKSVISCIVVNKKRNNLCKMAFYVIYNYVNHVFMVHDTV